MMGTLRSWSTALADLSARLYAWCFTKAEAPSDGKAKNRDANAARNSRRSSAASTPQGKTFCNAIDGYQVLETLGGNQAISVLSANHILSGRQAVLKVIDLGRARPQDKFRFDSELRILSKLNEVKSPQLQIARLLDSGQVAEKQYLLLERLAGQDCLQWIKRSGPADSDLVCQILEQLAQSLYCLHESGIVHCDVAPRNVIVARGDSAIKVWLVDFGLSRCIQDANSEPASASNVGTVSGSPAFMSPEVCSGSGQISYASDVYSFGCFAFYLLTGKIVYSGITPVEICWKQIHAPLPDVAKLLELPRPRQQEKTNSPSLQRHVPSQLVELLLECIAKSPTDRPKSMETVIGTLRECGISNS